MAFSGEKSVQDETSIVPSCTESDDPTYEVTISTLDEDNGSGHSNLGVTALVADDETAESETPTDSPTQVSSTSLLSLLHPRYMSEG